ncbi:MAG: hypothetical protein ISN28_14335 [Ectothiorhodospiraceae bacterium AqS1]|nr:hypothetical protein [Ectothiorhodospiraceae bacterium AqS1]
MLNDAGSNGDDRQRVGGFHASKRLEPFSIESEIAAPAVAASLDSPDPASHHRIAA